MKMINFSSIGFTFKEDQDYGDAKVLYELAYQGLDLTKERNFYHYLADRDAALEWIIEMEAFPQTAVPTLEDPEGEAIDLTVPTIRVLGSHRTIYLGLKTLFQFPVESIGTSVQSGFYNEGQITELMFYLQAFEPWRTKTPLILNCDVDEDRTIETDDTTISPWQSVSSICNYFMKLKDTDIVGYKEQYQYSKDWRYHQVMKKDIDYLCIRQPLDVVTSGNDIEVDEKDIFVPTQNTIIKVTDLNKYLESLQPKEETEEETTNNNGYHGGTIVDVPPGYEESNTDPSTESGNSEEGSSTGDDTGENTGDSGSSTGDNTDPGTDTNPGDENPGDEEEITEEAIDYGDGTITEENIEESTP